MKSILMISKTIHIDDNKQNSPNKQLTKNTNHNYNPFECESIDKTHLEIFFQLTQSFHRSLFATNL